MEKINPKIIRVDIKKLLLDSKNPRLPANIKNPRLPANILVNKQDEIWKHMKKLYDLDELALSITNNGYFEAEPMVVIPSEHIFEAGDEKKYDSYSKNSESTYIVVEGNRRLATVMGLLNKELDYPISDSIRKQFQSLPVLFYPNRDDVLAFLGVHHLAGVRKWNVYERARYIALLKEEKNLCIDEIQNMIGDRKNSARKIYICYRMVKQLEKYDNNFGLTDAKKNFSLLLLATGQQPIRNYLGFTDWNAIQDIERPLAQNKLDNLHMLFQCIFDSNASKRLIAESRDITQKLRYIFASEIAIKILKNDKNIDLAFRMSGGELEGILNMLDKAKNNLEFSNGKLSGLTISDEDTKVSLISVVGSMEKIIQDIKNKLS